jgi:hypothetical protein
MPGDLEFEHCARITTARCGGLSARRKDSFLSGERREPPLTVVCLIVGITRRHQLRRAAPALDTSPGLRPRSRNNPAGTLQRLPIGAPPAGSPAAVAIIAIARIPVVGVRGEIVAVKIGWTEEWPEEPTLAAERRSGDERALAAEGRSGDKRARAAPHGPPEWCWKCRHRDRDPTTATAAPATAVPATPVPAPFLRHRVRWIPKCQRGNRSEKCDGLQHDCLLVTSAPRLSSLLARMRDSQRFHRKLVNVGEGQLTSHRL